MSNYFLYNCKESVVCVAEGSLCLQDIENLKQWQFSLSPSQGDTLTKQGREDLYLLGRRLRSYFPELLNTTTYSPDKYLVSLYLISLKTQGECTSAKNNELIS